MSENVHEPKTEVTVLDNYALKQVRFRARKLIGKLGFKPTDQEDIEQELILHLLKWLPHYDPAKSARNTYLQLILKNKVSSIRRKRIQWMRSNAYETVSIEKIRKAERDSDHWAEKLIPDLETFESRHGNRNRTRREESELNMDVASVMGTLPPKLRHACVLLARHSKAQVAKQMGLSRTNFETEIIFPIHNAFEKAGIDAYRSCFPQSDLVRD